MGIVAHSKGVFGVTFNPLQPERLATFSEDGVVRLWDIRNLNESISFSFFFLSSFFTQIELL